MANQQNQLQTSALQKLKAVLNNSTMQQSFKSILADNAGAFMASIIELFQSDKYLQECDPNKVLLEALKAATLKLSINKQMGFAYIVPYNKVPTFQIGYKGYIQLAMRTGQYRYINADIVYEGETVTHDRITGMVEIGGEPQSDKPIGYFAYFELLNGFKKAVYWTREKVTKHAQAKSKSWKVSTSAWHTDFDAMALKTVLRNILSKYGVMSIEFVDAMRSDFDDAADAEVAEHANQTPVTINGEFEEDTAAVESEATQQPEDATPDMPPEPGF